METDEDDRTATNCQATQTVVEAGQVLALGANAAYAAAARPDLYVEDRPARDLAGLPGSLTFHDLRHAAASRLIGARLDPVTVAAVLGHEDPTVTLRVYAHLWDRERTDDAVRIALSSG
jgi:integrase